MYNKKANKSVEIQYSEKDLNRFKWHYDRLYRSLDMGDVDEFKKRLNSAVKKGFPIDHVPYDRSASLLQVTVADYDFADEFINLLLDNGADVNKFSSDSYTTLMLACSSPLQIIFLDDQTFQRIVSLSNVNLKNRYSNTALDYLARSYIVEYPYTGTGTDTDNDAFQRICVRIKMLLNAGAQVLNIKKWSKPPARSMYNRKLLTTRKERILDFLACYNEQKAQLSPKVGVCYDYEL